MADSPVATEEPHQDQDLGPAELGAAPGHEAAGPDAHPGGGHGHPSPVKYVFIAMFLAVVTALEVGLYYISMPDYLLVGFLLLLAAVKFSMVAAFFMHLKFDSPMLRRVFVTGIILATFCYTVVLFTLHVLVGH